jgi:methyl-accepting chemotaxis protein
MTVVGRVRRGYTILAILILLTAGLYVARYLAVDRPNGADRVTEQGLTAVGQTVPTSVAMYSAWIDKGLLFGGMTIAAPTILIDDARAATTALSQMNGRLGGGAQPRLVTLRTTFARFLTVSQKTFALEQAYKMDQARVLAASQVNGLTEQVLTATSGFRQAAIRQLAARRAGRDTASTIITIMLVVVFAGAALASVVMVVRIPRDIAAMVRGAVGDLEHTTVQVSAVSTQLASGAAQTAAAVSEAATTVDEVRQTSMLASQKSTALADGAKRAEEAADVGRRALVEIVENMGDIESQVAVMSGSIVRLSEQTEAIAALTATSHDIAEQSNLLAVNAAIEAAKSAEEGKGFSVVADEIKSLSGQSKNAVQQVRKVLADIVQATTAAVDAAERSSGAIARSVERVAGSSEAIESLAGSVEMTARSSLQIAASSQQQLVGMDQISQSMESINQASVHNAAAAREMAEELARLRAVAERLQAMIGTADEAYMVDDADPVAVALSGVREHEPAVTADDAVAQPVD